MIFRRLENNETDRKALYEYLLLVDSDFTPHLSDKTDLLVFSSKILAMGNAFVCVNDLQQICGLITFYNNDHINRISYCSILSVLQTMRGHGIASKLVDLFIAESTNAEMKVATVHTNNRGALCLYLKKGFEVILSDEKVIPERFFLQKTL